MQIETKYFKTIDLEQDNFKEIEKIEKKTDFYTIFVDGSLERLWKNKYLFKVAYLVFKNWNVIDRGTRLKQEEISEKKSSHMMRFFEVDIAREMSEKYKEAIIILDGTLSGMRRKDYEWMKEKKMIGISKETNIAIEGILVPIFLQMKAMKKGIKKPWIYYPFISEKKQVYFWDTAIMNFNRRVPAFRIDFLNLNENDVFSILLYYSINPICFGYPLPLVLVHKGAQISNIEYLRNKYNVEEIEDKELDTAIKIYNNWIANFRGVWE